jgi:hypothetical protein
MDEGGESETVDFQIVEGYRRIPQGDDPWAERLARESIAEEPWTGGDSRVG